MLEVTSDFLNDIDGKHPAREMEYYEHTLQIDTDEEIISIRIEELPKGLSFDEESRLISGEVYPLNDWHPIRDYERSSISGRGSNEIYMSDMKEYEQSENVATIGYLREHKYEPHYTGMPEYLFGSKAWVLDTYSPVLHTVIVIIDTWKEDEKTHKKREEHYEIEKEFKLAPKFSNKTFLTSYSEIKPLRIDNEEVTLEEFFKWYEDNGFALY